MDYQSALIDALDPAAKKKIAPEDNTGFAGGMETKLDAMPKIQDAPATAPAAATKPDYTKMGDFAGAMQGYNMDKFNRPYDQLSEKYKVGLVNSHFDPNKGITPEYLDALNSLGIADYSGSGDKLTAQNGRNGGRYGAGGTADTIVGLKSGGNAKWGYWTDPELEAQAAQPQGGGMFAGSSISPMLQGDAQANIQQALGAMQQPNLLQQLLAQLQQGAQ